MIAAAALAGAGLLAAAPGPSPARVALTVSPSHLALAAGARATVHVTGGAPASRSWQRLVLRATLTGVALDPHGRPRIAPLHDRTPLLVVRPRVITIGPRGATFTLAATNGARWSPGDHCAIVLITATPTGRRAVAVAMRIGLVATVRVPGKQVRRLRVLGARIVAAGARARLIAVTLANRGNVIETVSGTSLGITLLRRGRILARLRPRLRALLPRTRSTLTVRWSTSMRGAVVARVALQRPGGAEVRTFPLRL